MCLLVGKAPAVELGEVEALRLPQRKINRNQSLAQKSPPNLQVINQATRPQVKQKEGLVKIIGVITDGKMTKIKMLLAKRLLPQKRHRKNQRLLKPSRDQRFRCGCVVLINVAYHGKTYYSCKNFYLKLYLYIQYFHNIFSNLIIVRYILRNELLQIN